MRLSLNEVQIMCQRAAAGAGLPFGLAEDCAAAAAWLTAAGLSGVEVFQRALGGFLAQHAVAVRRERGGRDYRLVPAAGGCRASALFAGPALSDRIVLHAAGSQQAPPALAGVDEPLLVIACTAIGPGAPMPLTIRWQRRDSRQRFQARCIDGSWALWGDEAAGLERPGPADMSTSRGAPGDEASLPCLLTAADIRDASRYGYEQGAEVDDDAYQWVNAHARKMLVADSHRSRVAGAGAGLRDND